MNLILNYPIVHTGGRFVGNLFRQGCSPSCVWLGDSHFRERGRQRPLHLTACKQVDAAWVYENLIRFLLPREKANSSIVVAHGHLEWWHKSELQAALANSPSKLKVFTHLRDPLLILNTILWTKLMIEGHPSRGRETNEQRIKRAKSVADSVADILSMLEDNVFIYPVDLIQKMSEPERLKYTRRLMGFCGVSFTPRMRSLIQNWNLVGSSKKALASQNRVGGEDFLRCKESIAAGGTLLEDSAFQKILGVEFAFLQKQEALKEKLYNLGYKNLAWY